MIATNPTQFPELNAVLEDLVENAKRILGDNFFGAYLVGSFAVGDADIHSDCDFLIVVNDPLTPKQEASLRKLHNEIPTRPEHWAKHLEGSYTLKNDLGTLDALGQDWLYIDHGHREMERSPHCNSLEHRWSLHECGIVLSGPDPKTFTAKVPPEAIRENMHKSVQSFLEDLESWISLEGIAWAQRYAVTTLCRILYSMETGNIASKKESLLWATSHLDQKWSGLIHKAMEGRSLGFNPDELPSPEDVDATRAFIEYAKDRAISL
ncbi:MAG: DUF4111 domain-containing protein [Abitibacteriaceae bacterium]|nr:DUF4111 domain-containing protein [Abditibacteriaceae bacterium]